MQSDKYNYHSSKILKYFCLLIRVRFEDKFINFPTDKCHLKQSSNLKLEYLLPREKIVIPLEISDDFVRYFKSL